MEPARSESATRLQKVVGFIGGLPVSVRQMKLIWNRRRMILSGSLFEFSAPPPKSVFP
jgi:hypothetical protein